MVCVRGLCTACVLCPLQDWLQKLAAVGDERGLVNHSRVSSLSLLGMHYRWGPSHTFR